MNIGYTVKGESTKELTRLSSQGKCQRIEEPVNHLAVFEEFESFLSINGDQTLVVVNLESIGLQLTQLHPLIGKVLSKKIDLRFLETAGLSNQEYLQLIYDISESEKAIIRRRTLNGLEKAKEKGKLLGRPQTSPKKIERMRSLHEDHHKTLREIAVECDVSLGTVHKYISTLYRQ